MTIGSVKLRLGAAVFWTLIVLIIAAATHIVSILLMPRLAPKNAYHNLANQYPAHQLVVLSGEQMRATPFHDPAMLGALCLFDVSAGPVRLRGPAVADQLTTMSMHSDRGDVFYSLTDRSALQGRFDIEVMTQAQLDAAEANDNEDEPAQELRILAPSARGFIIIQTFMERPSSQIDAHQRLNALSCTQELGH